MLTCPLFNSQEIWARNVHLSAFGCHWYGQDLFQGHVQRKPAAQPPGRASTPATSRPLKVNWIYALTLVIDSASASAKKVLRQVQL